MIKNKLVSSIMAMGICSCVGLTVLAKPEVKPINVLLLTVDDMNFDSVGAFGCKVLGTTPNIDKLAEESMRFMHAHTHASSCVPSRNVIMTSRYLYNSGVEGFYGVPRDIVNNPTLPEFFKTNGYFAMIRGKESHTTPYYPFPEWDINFGSEKRINGNTRDPDTFYSATCDGIEAAAKADKPFFYNINIYDPHLALYNWNPKTGVGLNRQDKDNHPSRIYKPGEIVVPGFLPDTPKVRQEVAAYYSTVRRADDSVGQVVKALRDTGVYDNTVIIFLSDHGMPFPFVKTAMYYQSTHTPLIIRWPGVTKGGAVDDEHVLGAIDLFPSLAEGLGMSMDKDVDGRSFFEVLSGGKQDNRDFVYTMYEENVGGNRQPTRSVISKEYGYIVNLWSDGKREFATATKGMASTHEIRRLGDAGDEHMTQRLNLFTYRVPEEFFDYKNDPDALHNLIDDPKHQKRIEEYRSEMVRLMKVSNDPLLAIYKQRHDKEKVEAYLTKLDAESKARKADIRYSRHPEKWGKKKKNKNSKLTDEERRKRREARKAKQ